MKKLLWLGGLLMLAALALYPLTTLWLDRQLQSPLPLPESTLFEVAPGTGLARLSQDLDRRGWLGQGLGATQQRLALRLLPRLRPQQASLRAGEYRLEPGQTLGGLLTQLREGRVVLRPFRIIEGSRFRDIRAHLATLPGLRHDSAGLSDAALMAALGQPERHPEGWFAPDTYFYSRGDSDLTLLARAMDRQETLLAQAWAERAPDLPLAEAYEALILASIVERETGVAAEREEIAGVFVNRLRRGMRLQTDPTVIYGMGERYEGRIRRRDLREPTPYNTYVIAGLPPTPIAMPGAAAIRAAVNPTDTQNLYFVARGDGSHVFSRTLAEHERAVRQYQLQRRADYRSSPAPTETP